MTTTQIPHSLDAVIEAVQALIDGRPVPTEWQVEKVAPAPEPLRVPAAQSLDEVALMQGISDLIDSKLVAVADGLAEKLRPLKVEDQLRQLGDHLGGLVDNFDRRISSLEQARSALKPGFEECVLLALEIQKEQSSQIRDLVRRIEALEAIMNGLSAAVHKEDLATRIAQEKPQ